jgi:hypothetical protein
MPMLGPVSVLTVPINVTLVKKLLPTVLCVSHQDLESQIVPVQMELMITVTLVLLVNITVPPVTTEILVYLVQLVDN